MHLGSGTDISPTVVKHVAYILGQDEIAAKSTGFSTPKNLSHSTQDCMLENAHVSLEQQKARNNPNAHQLKSDQTIVHSKNTKL